MTAYAHTQPRQSDDRLVPYLTASIDDGRHEDVFCSEPLVDVPHSVHVAHAQGYFSTESQQILLPQFAPTAKKSNDKCYAGVSVI